MYHLHHLKLPTQSQTVAKALSPWLIFNQSEHCGNLLLQLQFLIETAVKRDKQLSMGPRTILNNTATILKAGVFTRIYFKILPVKNQKFFEINFATSISVSILPKLSHPGS